MVNTTSLASRRHDGQRSAAPANSFAETNTLGDPPAAGTLIRSGEPSVANTIVSFGPQVAPRRNRSVRMIVDGGPPSIGTFLIVFIE
jgi:hypothetical protein